MIRRVKIIDVETGEEITETDLFYVSVRGPFSDIAEIGDYGKPFALYNRLCRWLKGKKLL